MRFISKIDPYKFFVFFGGIIVFFFLYPQLFLHPNSFFIASEGDSMKNYFTYAYQVKHGDSMFNFNGLNYPYGEHITFTDGQPLLTIILFFFPFLGDYSIGIMNFLVIMSFALIPYVVYLILQKFSLDKITCLAGAFSVAILSPQILRLSGHFSLSYGVPFPLLILLIVKFFEKPTKKISVLIGLLTIAMFLLHPYTGFAFTLFTCLCFVFYYFTYRKSNELKLYSFGIQFLLSSVVGIFIFKLFLFFTDHHGFRYDTPYGYNDYKASIETVFVPFEGPFRHFLSQIFKVHSQEMEGIGYVGIATVFTLTVTILLKIIYFKKFKLPKYTFIFFIPAVILLLLSFGVHLKFGDAFTNLLGPIKQFRALGRFCWMFYYISTIFCFVFIAKIYETFFEGKKNVLTAITAVAFCGLFMLEAKTYHIDHNGFVAKDRNKFLLLNLTHDQQKMVAELKKKNYQCIITLPYFHIGSEFFQRDPKRRSYVEAMVLSYHTGLPLMGNVGSRTALAETKNELRVLNPFTDKTKLKKLRLNKLPIAVVVLEDTLLLDEQEFLKKCTYIKSVGKAKLYFIEPAAALKNEQKEKYGKIISSKKNSIFSVDSSFFIFKNKWLNNGIAKNYLKGKINGHVTLLKLNPGSLPLGKYVVSFRYNYNDKDAEIINNNVHFENQKNGIIRVLEVKLIRGQTGIFKNYIVFENELNITDTTVLYHLYMSGLSTCNKTFRVSNLMVRKRGSTVLQTNSSGMVIAINNYPINRH